MFPHHANQSRPPWMAFACQNSTSSVIARHKTDYRRAFRSRSTKACPKLNSSPEPVYQWVRACALQLLHCQNSTSTKIDINPKSNARYRSICPKLGGQNVQSAAFTCGAHMVEFHHTAAGVEPTDSTPCFITRKRATLSSPHVSTRAH